MTRFEGKAVYLACGAIDMRKSINGLTAKVAGSFGLDPFSEAYFVFCNRNRDRVKILEWDGDAPLRGCVELHMNFVHVRSHLAVLQTS